MNDAADRIAALVRHFGQIERTHMRGLPILNPQLAVEATGVRALGEHLVVILISPWFMNLVVLPGTEEWNAREQGECFEIDFPSESLEFSVCHDADLGTYLTLVLFRTVSDFPDQDTAREVATEVVRDLFTARSTASNRARQENQKTISRRSLLTGRGAN